MNVPPVHMRVREPFRTAIEHSKILFLQRRVGGGTSGANSRAPAPVTEGTPGPYVAFPGFHLEIFIGDEGVRLMSSVPIKEFRQKGSDR